MAGIGEPEASRPPAAFEQIDEGPTTDAEPLLVRAAYFDTTNRLGLREVTAALDQLSRYVELAPLLAPGAWPSDAPSRTFRYRPSHGTVEDFIVVASGEPLWPAAEGTEFALQAVDIEGFGASQPKVEVASIEIGSLHVLLRIPGELVGQIGIGLVKLGERICISPIRVSRKRKEELLKKRIVEKAIEEVDNGRADGLALQILSNSQIPGLRPKGLDVLDPGDPDGADLEVVEGDG